MRLRRSSHWNADENGGVGKRFKKWSFLKTHRFESSQFLVWIGENGGLKTVPEKSVKYWRFHQRFVRFSVDNRRKHIEKYAKTHSCEEVKTNRKLMWAKMFCFVLVETRTDTFKNAFVWSGPKSCLVPPYDSSCLFWPEGQNKIRFEFLGYFQWRMEKEFRIFLVE